MPQTIEVFVQLLNEGTEVYRPTKGVLLAPDVVRLLETPGYDPELEEWEFAPGSAVGCVLERRCSGLVLIARERLALPEIGNA